MSSYVRHLVTILPCLLLLAVIYLAFSFPVKQDRYDHHFLGHVPDRVIAYLRLFSSAHRARNAQMAIEEIDGIIDEAGRRYGVDPAVIRAIVAYESAYLPNTITTTGAMGLMALMPRTARLLGVRDPFDPRDNLDSGTRLVARLIGKFGGDLDLVLAAYNAGENTVLQANGVPPARETQDYVRHIRRLVEGCHTLQRNTRERWSGASPVATAGEATSS